MGGAYENLVVIGEEYIVQGNGGGDEFGQIGPEVERVGEAVVCLYLTVFAGNQAVGR
mgnify:CR=1 FL=1